MADKRKRVVVRHNRIVVKDTRVVSVPNPEVSDIDANLASGVGPPPPVGDHGQYYLDIATGNLYLYTKEN